MNYFSTKFKNVLITLTIENREKKLLGALWCGTIFHTLYSLLLHTMDNSKLFKEQLL